MPKKREFFTEVKNLFNRYDFTIHRNFSNKFLNFLEDLILDNTFNSNFLLPKILLISDNLFSENQFINNLINKDNTELNEFQILFKELTLSNLHFNYFSYSNITTSYFKTSYAIFLCSNCPSYFLSKSESNLCKNCSYDSSLFTTSNDMVPDFNNSIFYGMTEIEKNLCAKQTTVCKFIHTAYASFSSGNCVLIEKTPEKILEECLTLPRTPDNSDIIYFLKADAQNLSNFFFARRNVLSNTLRFLKSNHIDYRNISISINNANDISDLESNIFIRSNFLNQENNTSIPSTNNLNDYLHVTAVSRVTPPTEFSQISPLPQQQLPAVLDYENQMVGFLLLSSIYLLMVKAT